MKQFIFLALLGFLLQGSLYAQTQPVRPGQTPKLASGAPLMKKTKTNPKDKKMGLTSIRHTENIENRAVAQGFNALESGNVDAAIDQLDDYSNTDPDAAFGLGMAYYRNGQADKAIAQLERATDMDKTNSDALFELGQIYVEEGDFSKAEEQYLQILAENPKDAETWYELGFVYSLSPEFYQDAEYCFYEAERNDPDDPYASYELSRLLALQDDVDGALEKLEDAFKKGFDDPDTVREDPDLDAVRETEAFNALMDRYFPR